MTVQPGNELAGRWILARPIRSIDKSIPNPAVEQAQALSDIINALSENRDAIVVTLDILKNLHEMGALNTISALLQQRTEVGAIAIQQMNQPGMQHVFKNIMSIFNFLGSMDTNHMQSIVDGLTRGLEYATERLESGKNPSLWELGTSMRNPEVKKSLSTMVDVLHGLGEAFQDDKKLE